MSQPAHTPRPIDTNYSSSSSIPKRDFTINDLPLTERPRERLVRWGPEALAAQELLAIILGRGGSGESVTVVAQRLLSRFGSLHGLSMASLQELLTVKGVGLAKATQLQASCEVMRRAFTEEQQQLGAHAEQDMLLSVEKRFAFMKPRLRDNTREHYWVISCDNRYRALSCDHISIGTINASLVHPRETFSAALARQATSIIISHNHPSGDPQPSSADYAVTRRLAQAGDIIGIELLDHLIITKTSFFSFQDEGLLG